jgi:hypothetical protein
MATAKKSAAGGQSAAIPDIVIVPSLRSGTSSAEDTAERAATALPALGQALAAPMADFWRNLTRDANLRPDEVEVALGLSLEGGTKWAIVATVGATIEVKMKWGRAGK